MLERLDAEEFAGGVGHAVDDHFGMTDSTAFVTMGDEPVNLNPDGTFTARVPLPDRRQVIPIVASSRDGVEEQTIVLAVERNTKVMEAKIRQPAK